MLRYDWIKSYPENGYGDFLIMFARGRQIMMSLRISPYKFIDQERCPKLHGGRNEKDWDIKSM